MGGERRDMSLQQVGRYPGHLFLLGECRCAGDSIPNRGHQTRWSQGGKAGRGICGMEIPTLLHFSVGNEVPDAVQEGGDHPRHL